MPVGRTSVECRQTPICHACPKDFTVDCIINTVLEHAPLFIRFIDGDLSGLEINRSTGLQSRKLKR